MRQGRSQTWTGRQGNKLYFNICCDYSPETEVQEEMIKQTEVKVVEASPRLNHITRNKDIDPLESVSNTFTELILFCSHVCLWCQPRTSYSSPL